jgi:nucleotide-binding universal stress UspA family protein
MILIAFDGSPDAQAAVRSAAELFRGEPATILTVWEPFEDLMARTGAGRALAPGVVDFATIDGAYEQSAAQRAEQGTELAEKAGLVAESRTRAQRSTIAAAILAEAEEVGASTIVVGTRGLTGIKSALLGSVSHAVIRHADRPVVVVPAASRT